MSRIPLIVNTIARRSSIILEYYSSCGTCRLTINSELHDPYSKNTMLRDSKRRRHVQCNIIGQTSHLTPLKQKLFALSALYMSHQIILSFLHNHPKTAHQQQTLWIIIKRYKSATMSTTVAVSVPVNKAKPQSLSASCHARKSLMASRLEQAKLKAGQFAKKQGPLASNTETNNGPSSSSYTNLARKSFQELSLSNHSVLSISKDDLNGASIHSKEDSFPCSFCRGR